MPGESSTRTGSPSLIAFGAKWLGGLKNAFRSGERRGPSNAQIRDYFQRPGGPQSTWQPASPAQPVVPQLPTVQQATAQPPTRNEPKRGRARKVKAKKAVDKPVTWEDVSPFVYDAYARAIQGGIGGGGKRTAYNSPPMGSKSAQRGFVGNVATGPLAGAREMARNTEMNRRLDMVREVEARTGRAISAADFERWDSQYSLDERAEFDPKWGEELEPAVAPGGEPLEPVKVPKRWTSDISPIEVPQRTRYGTGSGTGTGTSQQVRPRSGPAPAMPGTGGKPQPTGKSAPGAPTGRRAPRIPGATAGTPVLSLDALLSSGIKSLTKRTPTSRPAFPGTGATSPVTGTRPGTAPQSSPQPDYLGGGYYNTSRADDCDCERKKSKPRKPRSQCWKGSYIETAKGLKKTRREQVSC